ncbi:sortase [Candidatus Saccharibacteria bacterium]|nr:sortase [Candidatus Saccharibacteria bacterium]
MKSLRKKKNTEGKERKPRSKKSKISIIALSLVAFISFLVLIWPYIPRLIYLITKPKISSEPYEQASKDGKLSDDIKNQKGNRLVLPQIGINAEIIEGDNINVIGKNQGVWRESPSVDPSTPGNIVIAGHRFLYTATNGGYFYNLTDMKNGDKIYIKWKDKIYAYEIYNSKTVKPDQIEIRDADPDVPNKLTMYTCYPLGSTAERYVIEAKQL